MRFVQRRLDSPGQRDVILFQQNCIIEPETMVAAATRLHCILFQRPQSRSRFPRIPDARLRARQLFHKAPRQRGNSAKMSAKIQLRSLAREDRPGVSLDLHDLRARFYKRSVIVREGDAYFRIQRAEDLLGEWQTRANERLSGEDFSPRRRPWRYHCRGRGVPGADIFFQCRSEEHTSELQSRVDLVCRLLLEKKKYRVGATKVRCVLTESSTLSTTTLGEQGHVGICWATGIKDTDPVRKRKERRCRFA